MYPAIRPFIRLLPPLLAALLSASTLADLLVNPKRVVFEGNQRTAQLDLVNSGSTPATYRISLENKRMTDNGDFLPVDTPLPDERFADSLLRYAPRQITLAPGEAQTVRIMVRKPADLASGEYRSHLVFERLPESAPASPDSNGAPAGLSVNISVLIGISIPVIVRHGELAAAARLTDATLIPPHEDKPARVSVNIQREGNRSVYGDLSVQLVGSNGNVQELGMMGGVSVYASNPQRRVQIPLQVPPGQGLKGTLRISYRERPDAGGKLLAETTLTLP